MKVGYISPEDLKDPKDGIMVIQQNANTIIDKAVSRLAQNLFSQMPDGPWAGPNFAQAVRYLCGRVFNNMPKPQKNSPGYLLATSEAIYVAMNSLMEKNITDFYVRLVHQGVLDPKLNKANYENLLSNLAADWDKAQKKLTLLEAKATMPLVRKISKKLEEVKTESDTSLLRNYIQEVGLRDYFQVAFAPGAKFDQQKTSFAEGCITLRQIVTATNLFNHLDLVITTAAMDAARLDYTCHEDMLKFFPEAKPVQCRFPTTNSKTVTDIKILDVDDIKALLEKYDSVNYQDLNGNTIYLIADREKLNVLDAKASTKTIRRELAA